MNKKIILEDKGARREVTLEQLHEYEYNSKYQIQKVSENETEAVYKLLELFME